MQRSTLLCTLGDHHYPDDGQHACMFCLPQPLLDLKTAIERHAVASTSDRAWYAASNVRHACANISQSMQVAGQQGTLRTLASHPPLASGL